MEKIIRLFVLLLSMAMLGGCALMQPAPPPLDFSPAAIPAGQYDAKINNFQVILDASMTMGIRDQQGLQTAKNFASALNRSIPADLTLNGGLRTFGHSDRQSAKMTELVYGMTAYSQSGFQQGLDKIKFAGGTSPLAQALTAAGADLSGASGKSAIIVISDGLQMEDAPAAAKAVKAKMGDNLCIYTVAIGDVAAGRALLDKVAQAGGCGFASADAALTTQAAMRQFVEQVFLTAKVAAPAPPPAPAVVDSDGDGVPDHLDRCPGTPRGVQVDQYGCPIDSDGDGVPDYLDRCPGTPKGTKVDEHGCEIKFTLNIRFDTNQAVVKPQYHNELAEAAEFTKHFPDLKILVAGHTDSTGNAQYNKDLSMRRAQAVKDYLVSNFGVNAEQLYVRGYGLERPIADNATPEGRQLNRRVELVYTEGIFD